MSEPIFLELDEVFRIHSRSLAEHGGSDGVRDRGLVESALASARNTFHYAPGDLFDVAASYAFHLSEAQAFIDGNKRTAVVAAMVFLARNGVYVRPSPWELYLAMIDVAAKKKTKADLADIFRKRIE
ncbi:MAG TPA: type II toxin-antitoxin system death-on-curing family toxin [Verrucomicrobiae bacterium]|nr:type II toxin-antitoxin system death-on-curing family toxin [Verrucomicrobiae bacterium]